MSEVNVCLSPALIPLFGVEKYIVVIIDIFRATSSICYGIDNGAEAIIPVAEVEECLAYQEKYPHYLLAAERNGEVVNGFDFGNSPFSYTKEKVTGKTVVLTTTNGTHALHLSRNAKKVVIGSFLNLTAICDWLKTQQDDVLLVCAGWKNNFNLEDTVFAGAVTYQLTSLPATSTLTSKKPRTANALKNWALKKILPFACRWILQVQSPFWKGRN
jgi:2-phosphosulfolactate phosphatase